MIVIITKLNGADLVLVEGGLDLRVGGLRVGVLYEVQFVMVLLLGMVRGFFPVSGLGYRSGWRFGLREHLF